MKKPPSQSESKVQAFLFDIGNVLLKFDFGLALRVLAEKSRFREPAEVMVAVERVKQQYEDGQMGRARFIASAFELLDYKGTEAEFVAAWENIFEVNQSMVELVERLAVRYPLFLLSNTNDIHREFIFREYPFFGRFSGGIYSYEVGVSKPAGEIYRIAVRRLGLRPEATYFIDDLEANIQEARGLGFQCHQYRHWEHGVLLEDLRRIQVAGLPVEG
jgi:HAD superfamily hydrolase (TIGR01549 family)